MVRPATAAPALAPRWGELAQWLRWQQSLHVREIDLDLERCRRVAERMGLLPVPWPVVTVAGTNGKGSSVAMLGAALEQAGHRVARYTSPHLMRYNERIVVAGSPVDDATICAAFARVDAARRDTPLTYFEFGTLAALDIFRRAAVDVAVLEVGLGGRLDAVNIVDPTVALVTNVGIDHTGWLGPTREHIAREKCGVFRPGRPAVCADPDPPATVHAEAARVGARLYQLGRDFRRHGQGDRWCWTAGRRGLWLPLPGLEGRHQLDNAAGVAMALELLAERLPGGAPALARVLAGVRLPGRFQLRPGRPQVVLDVAHNPQAAVALAEALEGLPRRGRVHAVLGMFRDKDARRICAALAPWVDAWHVAPLRSPRTALPEALERAIAEVDRDAPVTRHADVAGALRAARRGGDADTVLVTGSFLTVSAALGELG